jgi:rod shape determining protein RodA
MLNRAFDFLARRIDGPLMAIICCLMMFGLATVYSASSGDMKNVILQGRNFALGFVVLWFVANTSPTRLMQLAVPLYVIGVVLLVGVFLAGETRNHAKRWLNLGIITIQPSEISKLAVPAVLAWYYHRKEDAITWRDHLLCAIAIIVPAAFIKAQPDMGTSLLVAGAGVWVVFMMGLQWRIIGTLTAIVAVASPFIWQYIMKPYQRQRVMTLLDPSQDPQGAGYHITQASIAIGSGGVLGKGWLNGTQGQLDFIPERHTDFILAVIGEEFGLIGILILCVLYLLLIGRGVVIAMQARTTFNRTLAAAITLTVFTYASVNLLMVMGLLPVVGVPLPLISFGGTAVLTLMLSFGILMSIHSHRNVVG